jgi:hypothetical protein
MNAANENRNRVRIRLTVFRKICIIPLLYESYLDFIRLWEKRDDFGEKESGFREQGIGNRE